MAKVMLAFKDREFVLFFFSFLLLSLLLHLLCCCVPEIIGGNL